MNHYIQQNPNNCIVEKYILSKLQNENLDQESKEVHQAETILSKLGLNFPNQEKKTNHKYISKRNYKKLIQKYKTEISKNPPNIVNKRNMLAYTYFKADMIDEAKKELLDIIKEYNNCTSYRLLIHIEKSQGNMEDAKLWAYEAIDHFPKNIELREQLISIDKKENDVKEIIEQLKEIIKINPLNTKNEQRLLDLEQEI